jgi:deazaflavin-dependent oxidoreductase (nitroreductase family)
MPRETDWNTKVIEEFRSNHGKVGGNFEGAPLLLIHHTGARTGTARVNPVMYLKDGERLLVFASKGGAPRNPGWYHNLKAHPDVQIEVGDDTIDVTSEELTGEERNRFYARQSELYPQFADYQKKTKRLIPVIAFKRRGGAGAGGARILPGAMYECERCGTRVSALELSKLPSPTCANCGYRVFRKLRGDGPKDLKAR